MKMTALKTFRYSLNGHVSIYKEGVTYDFPDNDVEALANMSCIEKCKDEPKAEEAKKEAPQAVKEKSMGKKNIKDKSMASVKLKDKGAVSKK